MLLERRSFIKGLAAIVAAPAIVKFDAIMPVKVMPPEVVLKKVYWGTEYEELAIATRSNLIPELVAQIYSTNGIMAKLIAQTV